ncbi:MAG: hypothetical protein AAGF59_04850 [Pseudomonadota bacterium]
MTDTDDKVLEHLRLISGQMARLELRQSEIAGRLASLERLAVDNDRVLGQIRDRLIGSGSDMASGETDG